MPIDSELHTPSILMPRLPTIYNIESIQCVCINRMPIDMDLHTIQHGEDPQDALSYRSFFAKEPQIIRFFCGK